MAVQPVVLQELVYYTGSLLSGCAFFFSVSGRWSCLGKQDILSNRLYLEHDIGSIKFAPWLQPSDVPAALVTYEFLGRPTLC